MFVVSKRNFLIPRSGREPYRIKKDYIGEIPDDVASHWLVQAAIADGSIAAPQGKKDTDLEQADDKAAENASKSDIRPDAHGSAGQESPEADGTKKKAKSGQ